MNRGWNSSRSTRIRTAIIGIAVPLAIAAISFVVMLVWLPTLPDPIAVHWSSASGPDGFGPALLFIFTPLIITILFAIFTAFATAKLTPSGRLNWTQKAIAVTGVWLSTMLSVAFLGSLEVQRGLDDAHKAGDVLPSLLLGLVLASALAVAAWFLLPKYELVPDVGQTPERVEIAPSERLSWMQRARLGTAGLILIGLVLVVCIGATVLVWVAGKLTWLPIVVLAFVIVLVVTNTWWWIAVDERGLVVRGILGWPGTVIPLSDIRSVQVIEVNASRDFGGWGWRWGGHGRTGVILTSGKAIEVTRSGGKRFAVTVDDAETGAGVIAALLSRKPAQSSGKPS
ncbi:MAG: DUF1648 domain-containing protein [Cryobacterium sp.]|nr:DUF1648 domain-containing protein [Cryobacterium sp.]MBX3089035.1 DUF1648 domain-containing protein [Cryobacterium sp.]MCO5294270.1 DUF1648 domain-containing protein [Homoserinimonas sp.]MCW5944335.1 DUF1648 domain-containing protein [Cryobacterium sp.]